MTNYIQQIVAEPTDISGIKTAKMQLQNHSQPGAPSPWCWADRAGVPCGVLGP